ncbi:hypothetical protein DUZ99_04750 [Xylanibacillus composti]|uniref:hypothetical protein n=1 Tax=Xylanibacillus composti TaxID=1572762 RepID=UPI001BD16CB9|nr:hypothetical protein [Xylanibacillus composti]MDT9724298.1 hypothetical protein [Xylanibacillus composti]
MKGRFREATLGKGNSFRRRDNRGSDTFGNARTIESNASKESLKRAALEGDWKVRVVYIGEYLKKTMRGEKQEDAQKNSTSAQERSWQDQRLEE